MSVQVTSTTDNEEAVTKAMGLAVESEENKESKGHAPESEVEQEDKTEETDSSEESEQDTDDEENSEEGSDDSEASEEEEEESEEDNGEEKPRKRRRGGYKRRVQKLSKKLSEAEREAEYWRKQALGAKGSEQDAGAEKDIQKETPADGRPTPDDFESPEDFVEALADWKFEQKMKAHDANKSISAQQKELEEKAQRLQKAVEEFSLEHDDFEELIEDINHIPVSATIQEALLDSDNGAALMYELAKHPEQYEKINSMPPVKAAIALGRFEAKYLSSSSKEKTKLDVKKKTNAPRPLNPVKSKGSGASTKSPDEMSFQEYKAWRAQQMRE